LNSNAPIQPLTSDGQPARHVIFDCEATIDRDANTETQRWAVGAVAVLRWSDAGVRKIAGPEVAESPKQLWQTIVAEHRGGGRLVAWAHNLAYDLRVSRALELLPRMGWRLAGIVPPDHGGWASFKSDRGTLLLCDLTAWVNAPLTRIAADLQLDRVLEPSANGRTHALTLRCVRDVQITTAAVAEIMEYVRSNGLGPFRPTGAGQCHAAWRRRFLTMPVVPHDDTVALAHERRAMWTGRCEAWRWGSVDQGELAEFDLNLAYCRLAAREQVPVELHRQVDRPTLDQYLRWRMAGGVMARVTVTTGLPLVPCEDGDRIYWPTGCFQTVLWQPEIDLLLAHGATVEFEAAWLYTRRPALRAFAEWLIDHLEGPDAAERPVTRRMLKHWSRAIVGRMALRYRSWEWAGRTAEPDLGLMALLELPSGQVTEQLQVGRDIFELAALTEAQSSVPMVTGWVMSACRAELWRLIELAGPVNVAYMDTDSLIVTAAGARRLTDGRVDVVGLPLGIRGTYSRATIHGPRQLDLDTASRFAGVPRRSVRRGPLEFDAERWSSIRTSLASGRPDTVTVEHVPVKVTGKDMRRIHLPGGWTAPHYIRG